MQTLVLVLFALLLLHWFRDWYWARQAKKGWTKEGIVLTDQERKLRVRERVEDKIVDGIEDLVLANEMTSKEAMEWYRKLGGQLGLPGLLPKAAKKAVYLPPTIVKEGIKNRLANGDHKKKVPLPDTVEHRPLRKESRLSRALNGIKPATA